VIYFNHYAVSILIVF